MKRSGLIRRTPLKRSTKPLRRCRGGARARRKEKAKQEVRHEYLFTHRLCQLCEILRPGMRANLATEPHHIFGRNWKGSDCEANLCAVCWRCHGIVGRTNEGKVIACYAKWRWCEWRPDELSAGVGYSVTGKFEIWGDRISDAAQRMAFTLITAPAHGD